MFKILKWILIVVGIIVLLMIVLGMVDNKRSESSEAPIVTANFVDLKAISAISKYRSCQGHLVVPQDKRETKRNMKHYFNLKKEYTSSPKMVKFYAPFDGYVSDIFKGFGPNEGRDPDSSDISISTSKPLFGKGNNWNFIFMHAIPKEGLKEGDKVQAGELIGYSALDIPPYYSFDIVYARMGTFPKRIDNWWGPYADLDSVFNHMTDKVLNEYTTAFGLSRKDDFIIPKETRDQNPCKYQGDGPRFDPNGNGSQGLNDYVGETGR